jgi:hypothetical protein
MAQGVADEVFQRPVQQSGVAAPGQSHGRAHEVEPLVRSQSLPVGQAAAGPAAELQIAALQRQFGAIEPGIGQHLLDEGIEAPRSRSNPCCSSGEGGSASMARR